MIRRALIGLCLLAGCDLDLDFHSEATTIEAFAEGNGSLQVKICAGPQDLLDCNEEELFEVSFEGVTVVAEAPPLLSFGVQYASFTADRPGSEVVVTRQRDGATATVTVPEPLELEAPEAGAIVSRHGQIELRWSPSGRDDALDWEATLECDPGTSSTHGDDVDDDGIASIDGGDLPPREEGCGDALALEMARSRFGDVVGFADDSSIIAAQLRRVDLHVAP